MNSKNNYIKGLDGLRGIAALLVVLGHVELLKKSFGLSNVYDGGGPFFIYLGSLSVTFFFVLSGFLITFLLIKEKEKYDTISIKKFYIRRILRIWPVYYLLFFLGFVLFPHLNLSIHFIPEKIVSGNYFNGFLYNILLLPNFSNVSNPIAFQSWSIGVEEQFYIIYPLLVYSVPSLKKISIILMSVVIGIYLMRSLPVIGEIIGVNYSQLLNIQAFFGESRFDNMAIGALFAILYYKKPEIQIGYFLKITIVCSLSIILISGGTKFGYGLDMPLAALVFAAFILVIITKKQFFILESRPLIYTGKISYGIYMYHVVGILLGLNLTKIVFSDFTGSSFISNMVLYFLSLCFTFLLSAVSYRFMERPFLKLKEKFSKI